MCPPPPDGLAPSRAPSPLQAEFGWLYSLAKEATVSQLAEERTAEKLEKLIARLERVTEREIGKVHEKIAAMGEKGVPLMPACRKGCYYCCSHMVTATGPELIRIADFVRTNWTAAQISELRSRIEEHKLATASWRAGVSEYPARHSCPLLDRQEGACTVWQDRPIVCRGWNSVNVEDCIEKHENPESGVRERALGPQVAIGDFVRQGLEEGLADHKTNGEICELAYGLGIALDNPDAGDRFLAGEDLFAEARKGLP